MDQKIFEGAVDFESSPQDATLGASGGFLSAILIHFDEAPTTSEKLIISYKNGESDAYTTELAIVKTLLPESTTGFRA